MCRWRHHIKLWRETNEYMSATFIHGCAKGVPLDVGQVTANGALRTFQDNLEFIVVREFTVQNLLGQDLAKVSIIGSRQN